MNDIFKDADIISTYTQQQAIEDGVLVEVFKNRWNQLTGGEPLLATSHVASEVTQAALLEIWNQFVAWREDIPHYPGEDEEEQRFLFTTEMNGKKIWLIWEIDQSYTMMYPEDY